VALGRGRHAIASGAACPAFHVLEQGDEAMPLERESKIGEHCTLDGDRKRSSIGTIGTVHHERPAPGKRKPTHWLGVG